MIEKQKEYDVKKSKNDTDFTGEVRKTFGNLPYIRLRGLIAKLESEHRNRIGYSRVTLGRKTKSLCDDKILVKVYSDDFKKYGIKDEATNAVYLLFKETTEIKDHIDGVMKLLGSDDPKDIALVLKELENYRNRYLLDSIQLDRFIEKLEIRDDKLRYSLFMLIFEQINRGVEPIDMPQLQEILRSLLVQYPLESHKQHSLRSITIELLAYCSDPIIIDYLIKDINAFDSSPNNEIFAYASNTYSTEMIANMVEENRSKLFALEKKFIKEGKENSANLISMIRANAIRNLDSINYQKRKAYLKSSWSPSMMR